MLLVDTNILVYAVHQRCPEQERCTSLLESLRAKPLPWFATWPIIYEFLRVTTHRGGFKKPISISEAWKFVEGLLASRGFSVLVETDRHAAVASQTLAELPDLRGSVMHDAHTAILMREHGVRRIYTRDLGFHRFPFLEVIDPLAPDKAAGRGDLEVRERARRSGSRSSAGRSRSVSRRPPVRR